ncbi:MAG: redoxin domain-containing protein [Tepidisphaeraceae bacterium]
MDPFRSSRLTPAAAFIGVSLLLASITQAENPPARGDTAPDFTLVALGAGPIHLADALAKGPVVVVVLRGPAQDPAPYDTQQLQDFLDRADAFAEAGAQVLFIYPGPVDRLEAHARAFLHDVRLPARFHLLLDADYVFTNAYRLRWDAQHETAHPATFVLNRRGEITYADVSHDHGHRVRAAEALKALARQ